MLYASAKNMRCLNLYTKASKGDLITIPTIISYSAEDNHLTRFFMKIGAKVKNFSEIKPPYKF